MALANSKLFTPLQVGTMHLQHRVVMAPLTRRRSPNHVPTDTVSRYYEQRSTPGGLIITEATHISPMGGNYSNAPGIWTAEQVEAWKHVTAAVHAKGGYIYSQLWHVGRTTHPVNLGGRQPWGPSANKMNGKSAFPPEGIEPQDAVVAHAMTVEEIKITVEEYRQAALNAIEAGFDGVEIHGANGYLVDQFLHDNVNQRTDSYGGSVQNRIRFPLEVVDAVASAVGPSRTGIRLSPFGEFQGVNDTDPPVTWSALSEELEKRGLAYVHFVNPRVADSQTGGSPKNLARIRDLARSRGVPESEIDSVITLAPFRAALKHTPVFSAGGYNAENAGRDVEAGIADAEVFGRWYISNPDLVTRLKEGKELSKYKRLLFYSTGPEGYVDYPTWEQLEEIRIAAIEEAKSPELARSSL